jgi:hypothetical protein
VAAITAMLPILAPLLAIVALAVAEAMIIARTLPSFRRAHSDVRPARELVDRWLVSAGERPTTDQMPSAGERSAADPR